MSTSTAKNPSFTFPESGTYTVQLDVTLPSGKIGTVTRDIDVFLLSDVSFTWDSDALEVTFTDTSIAPNIVRWEWNFGDYTVSSLQNPVHVFPYAGVFHVTLTIHTLNGGIGFTGDDVTVSDLCPGESVSASFTSVATELDVDFTDTSTADSGVVSWSWDFGDGVGTSSLQNPSYSYEISGTYTVTLEITSDCGNVDVFMDDVTVLQVTPPTAIFVAGDTKAAALAQNNHLYTTSNFQSSPPTWTDHSSVISNFESVASVDPFSPAYTGSGSTVDMFVLRNDGSGHVIISKLQDVFGSRTVTDLYTSTTSGQDGVYGMHVSRWQPNTLAVSYRRDIITGLIDSKESRIIVTYNGTTFTDNAIEDITPFLAQNSAQASATPFIKQDRSIRAVSSKWETIGMVTGAVDYYYDSPDGVTWTSDTDIHIGSNAQDVFFQYPLHDPTILYENVDTTGGSVVGIFKNGTNIAPTEPSNSSKVFAAGSSMAFSPMNEDIIYIAGASTGFTINNWYDDNTGTFTQQNKANVSGSSRLHCIIADASHAILAWGVNRIDYAPNFTTSPSNKAPVNTVYLAVATLP